MSSTFTSFNVWPPDKGPILSWQDRCQQAVQSFLDCSYMQVGVAMEEHQFRDVPPLTILKDYRVSSYLAVIWGEGKISAMRFSKCLRWQKEDQKAMEEVLWCRHESCSIRFSSSLSEPYVLAALAICRPTDSGEESLWGWFLKNRLELRRRQVLWLLAAGFASVSRTGPLSMAWLG